MLPGLFAMPLPPISRRRFLTASGVAAGLPALNSCGAGNHWLRLLRASEWRVFGLRGEPLDGLTLEREWRKRECTLRLRNHGVASARVGEVWAFAFAHGLPGNTPIYTEGFQMLSQTGGTIAQPEQIGGYTDAKHYRLPSPEGAFTGYNLLHLHDPASGNPLLAFSSCRRFGGKFHVRPQRIEVALDLDGIEIAPGETVELEGFRVFEGYSPAQAYAALADALRASHPPIFGSEPPQGWCSWYCFGPGVSADEVMSNLDFIAKQIPSLRYIQIDDGYQAAMGDWLETGQAFGGDVRAVLRQIKERGFEPAIWVAPFIAEPGSKVFQEHPDWFMSGADGQPLPSYRVTFGGWRRAPWYALDGTNPAVQRHLEAVFRTMREEWGVRYFKLDANFWGVLPQGRLSDPRATRIEAYRRGMESIRRGAGDAFLLGCNHPLWPSLGLIHGSRSSGDIGGNWPRVRRVARENLRRGWQNGRLWWNDPDVALLRSDLSENELHFHAASIYASGGMLLSGDDLPRLPPERLAILRKLSPPTGKAAVFDPALQEGRLWLGDTELLFLFNWGETVESLSVDTKGASSASDFWTGAPVGIYGGHLLLELQPHAARVFALRHGRS